MVLTDQDFGRAYITEGWATQFLTRMFARYTVVLVGYSAEDSIVQYLNRALPSGTRRLAFTKKASDYELWDRLDITPIPFPSTPENEYGALQSFLRSWRERETADAADRFDQVQRFIDAGVDAAQEDVSTAQWLLSDPELGRHFRTHARSSEWLAALDSLGVLDDVFASSTEESQDTLEWAQWIRASIDDDDGATLLAVLAGHEGRFHAALWFQIWHKLYGDFNGSLAHRKLAFVLAAAERERDDSRLSALVSQIVDKDPITAERLLVHLLEPTLHMKVSNGWGFWDDSLETRLRLRWRTSALNNAWPRLMPVLQDRGHLLSAILNLIRTVETTDAFFTGRGHPQAISVRRQQVEDGGLSLRDDAYVLVVDMGRDLLREAVRDHGVAEAMRLLDDQSEMNRRLAIDALADARSSEADELIVVLIQRGLPFVFRSRPEVFRLIAFAYENASEASKAAFIDYVQTASRSPEEHEIADYDRYNIFVWLSSRAPQDDPVRSVRDEIERQRGFEPDPSPNLTMGFSLTDSEPSTDAKGIFEHLSAEELVSELASIEALRDDFRSGVFLRELSAYFEKWPDRHLTVLDAMIAAQYWDDAVWKTVVEDLVRQDAWVASEILDRLDAHQPSTAQIGARIVFPVAYPTNELGGPVDNPVERTRLLLGLWKRSSHEQSVVPSTDFSEALGSGRGSLAHYYVETLLRAAQQEGDEARLTEEGTAGLLLLLDGQNDNPADPSPMMIAEYASFLAYRAPEWFDEHLAPRLDVLDGTPQSLTLWAGLLSRGLRRAQMRQRFRDQIRGGYARVKASLPSLVEDYIQRHAECFTMDSKPEDLAWPDAFLAHAAPDVRARWIRAVAYYLDTEEPSFQPLLFGHWQHRLDGQPVITPEEQPALLRWLTLPGINVVRATQLFTGGPTVTAGNDSLYDYYDLEDFPRAEYPAEYLRVAKHLMAGNRFPPPFAGQLVEVARGVGADDPVLARDALNMVLSLGYSPARGALQELDNQ